MTTWVLILFLKAGLLTGGGAYTTATVEGFKSFAACNAAGSRAVSELTVGKTDGRFVCVEVE